MAAIPPGAWLGLLGGGQLGRMFCMAAQSLGYRVAVLDPGAASPAGSVADRHIAADYLDPRGLAELAALAAAATTEFENVPAAALDFLARTARVTPCGGERGHRAGPDQREDVPVGPRLRRRAVRGAAQRSRTSTRVDAPAPARHREERALRLRRQGPGARCARATMCARRGARMDGAAVRARAAASRSPARCR